MNAPAQSQWEKAAIAFRNAYIYLATKAKLDVSDRILSSLWDQNSHNFFHFDINSLPAQQQHVLRDWAIARSHPDLLKMVNSTHFGDVEENKAVVMFEAKRDNISELRQLFEDLFRPNSRLGQFEKNFKAVQKLFEPHEMRKWAREDLFNLSKPYDQDKCLLLFRDLSYAQIEALIEGYFEEKQPVEVFENLLVGCWLAQKDQEPHVLGKLYKKMIELIYPGLLEDFLERTESDAVKGNEYLRSALLRFIEENC